MKEKIKEILTNKNLYFFTAITIIFFGVLIRMEFATDTYVTLTFTMQELINQFASMGRFVIIIAGGIIGILNLSRETIYFLSYSMAIICMIIGLYELYQIIKIDVPNQLARKIIPILIILNAFSIELFLFIEKGIMVFAICICIFAVESIKKWLETKQKKYLIKTFILMLLANFSYQGIVGIFVAISILYILKYSKNIKEFIINNIVVALNYGIPACIDYAIVRFICSENRVSGNINLVESIQKIILETKSMINSTYRILPENLLAILTLIILIIILYKTITKKVEIKTKIVDILRIFYILAGVWVATVAPQLMQNTASIWFVARSTYAYASLFGILILYLYMNYEVGKISHSIIILLSVILLIVQFTRFNTIITDRYKVNEMDYEITRKVLKQIEEYEAESGNKISKLAIYNDKFPGYTYNGIFATGDTNLKAYYKDWCIQNIIKYYSGRNLTIVESDSEKKEKFEQNDWTSFENEQIILENDTLHFCVY